MIKSKAPHEIGTSVTPQKKTSSTDLNDLRSKPSLVRQHTRSTQGDVSKGSNERVAPNLRSKLRLQKYRTLTEVLARLRIWSEKTENSQNQKGAAAFFQDSFSNNNCFAKEKLKYR